jgi:restriction system protein
MMVDDRPAWCVHMPRTLESKPITEGFVAIGWSEVGDLSKLPEAREAFREVVARTYPDRKPGSFPVTGGTLFKFVHEMERGDVVIHPSKVDRLVHIGTVDGDYVHLASGEGLPNRRKVKWLKHVPRAAFSQSALHEIGTAVTLSQVRNHLDEFLAALKGETLEPEEIDEAVTESSSEETEEATKDFVLKRLKSQLDPYQFEHFVAHLLERMGYHTRVTQQSGDGGIDILASKDELGFEKPIIKVQAEALGDWSSRSGAALWTYRQGGARAVRHSRRLHSPGTHLRAIKAEPTIDRWQHAGGPYLQSLRTL